jgi:hypothetical protein
MNRYLFIFSIPVPEKIPSTFQASHHSVSASYGVVCKVVKGQDGGYSHQSKECVSNKWRELAQGRRQTEIGPSTFQASHHSVSASYGVVCKIKRNCTLQIWDHAREG